MCSSVCRWVEVLPLTTVQRVLQLLFPQTSQSFFEKLSGDVDHGLMRCISWSLGATHLDEEPIPTMLIFVQAPWAVSLQDLGSFCDCESVSTLAISEM